MSTLNCQLDPNLALAELVNILCDPKHQRTTTELNALSIDARLRVFEDLAGSSQVEPEEPGFVNQKLKEMDEELSKIPGTHAYDLARQISPDFVDRQAFRLMFLRAEDFDPRQAAMHLTKHLEQKLELFGEKKVAKQLRLSDLDADDLESLASGGIQVLKRKDKFGRGVLACRYHKYKYKHPDNWLRAVWYVYQCLAEDKENQKLGMVSILYQVGESIPSYDYELLRREINFVKGSPLRFRAVHFCADSQLWMQVVDLAIHMASPFLRLRIRCHYGVDTECLYQLMTFGIPMSEIPWAVADEALQINGHRRWLEDRIERESAAKALALL